MHPFSDADLLTRQGEQQAAARSDGAEGDEARVEPLQAHYQSGGRGKIRGAQAVVRHAQLLVPTGTADSTGIEGYVGGALKQSLTFALDLAKKTVTIGSNLFYSVYVELGTGIFAEKGNGRKTPWVWKDFNGKWHFTRGMAPRPFLRPAVEDHIDELREIAVEEGNKEV